MDNKAFSPLVWYGPGKAQNNAINAELDPTLVEIAPGSTVERGASVYEGRSTYSDINFESFFNHQVKFNDLHSLKTTVGVSIFSDTLQTTFLIAAA